MKDREMNTKIRRIGMFAVCLLVSALFLQAQTTPKVPSTKDSLEAKTDWPMPSDGTCNAYVHGGYNQAPIANTSISCPVGKVANCMDAAQGTAQQMHTSCDQANGAMPTAGPEGGSCGAIKRDQYSTWWAQCSVKCAQAWVPTCTDAYANQQGGPWCNCRQGKGREKGPVDSVPNARRPK